MIKIIGGSLLIGLDGQPFIYLETDGDYHYYIDLKPENWHLVPDMDSYSAVRKDEILKDFDPITINDIPKDILKEVHNLKYSATLIRDIDRGSYMINVTDKEQIDKIMNKILGE